VLEQDVKTPGRRVHGAPTDRAVLVGAAYQPPNGIELVGEDGTEAGVAGRLVLDGFGHELISSISVSEGLEARGNVLKTGHY
jgi:hypothetical protein